MAKFKFLVCGGTFDLFHLGHKKFLQQALENADKVLIGITGDEYIHSFKNSLGVEDFQTRKNAVEQYLISSGLRGKVELTEINSAYEPYLETSEDYDAIAVTEQTQKTAQDINLKRKQNGIAELRIIVVPMALGEDGLEISSTRIRNGEINRQGRLYINPKWFGKAFVLTEELRPRLQQPWGEVLNSIPQNLDGTKVVTVGDVTTQKFNKQDIDQFLSIVDFQIHREVKFQNISELGFNIQNPQKVKNPHGKITPELFQLIIDAFRNKKRQIILIDGEDDLAVLPVLLTAPLGFNIFYGQPDEGLVQILVTEEIKERAYRLLESFDKK